MSTRPDRDEWAELTVIGCCIYSPEGSDLAHSRLHASDFFDPCLRDLFSVSPSLPAPAPGDPADLDAPLAWEIRAQAAADATDIRLSDIHTIVNRRLVLVDMTGYYARRVAAAAEHRRRLADLADELLTFGYTVVPLSEAPVDRWVA